MMDGSRRAGDSSDETVAIYNHYSPTHVRMLAEALGAEGVEICDGFWSMQVAGQPIRFGSPDSSARLAAYNLHHTLMQLVLSGVLPCRQS